jgi:hypothetical protein
LLFARYSKAVPVLPACRLAMPGSRLGKGRCVPCRIAFDGSGVASFSLLAFARAALLTGILSSSATKLIEQASFPLPPSQQRVAILLHARKIHSFSLIVGTNFRSENSDLPLAVEKNWL